MLTALHLTNFRCFEDHTIPFRATTVIVGQNNAGKSTIVEALRIVALVARWRGSARRTVPPWLRDKVSPMTRGLAPSLSSLEMEAASLCYRYGDPPASASLTVCALVARGTPRSIRAFCPVKPDFGEKCSVKNYLDSY